MTPILEETSEVEADEVGGRLELSLNAKIRRPASARAVHRRSRLMDVSLTCDPLKARTCAPSSLRQSFDRPRAEVQRPFVGPGLVGVGQATPSKEKFLRCGLQRRVGQPSFIGREKIQDRRIELLSGVGFRLPVELDSDAYRMLA